jgi:hypothetical protein
MDELEISGRRYISSTRAAKEHKYHSDYIGQLVRGGKVVGQKVGRAWYVDAESLSEYLGKEVPARSPLTKKAIEQIITKAESVGSEEESVAEPKIDVRDSSSDLDEIKTHIVEPTETPFIMPLRKSGRAHVIASIDETPVAHEVEPIVVEEKIIAQPVAEVSNAEEETFIPVKISNEATRNIYVEPEDSFYKVSRKGLRYVSASTPVAQKVFAEGKGHSPQHLERETRNTVHASVVAKSLSVVLIAGILSLGFGVLMSYYLHSITTVGEAGQTSSVILSN